MLTYIFTKSHIIRLPLESETQGFYVSSMHPPPYILHCYGESQSHLHFLVWEGKSYGFNVFLIIPLAPGVRP